jgi:hypothetical protein
LCAVDEFYQKKSFSLDETAITLNNSLDANESVKISKIKQVRAKPMQ